MSSFSRSRENSIWFCTPPSPSFDRADASSRREPLRAFGSMNMNKPAVHKLSKELTPAAPQHHPSSHPASQPTKISSEVACRGAADVPICIGSASKVDHPHRGIPAVVEAEIRPRCLPSSMQLSQKVPGKRPRRPDWDWLCHGQHVASTRNFPAPYGIGSGPLSVCLSVRRRSYMLSPCLHVRVFLMAVEQTWLEQRALVRLSHVYTPSVEISGHVRRLGRPRFDPPAPLRLAPSKKVTATRFCTRPRPGLLGLLRTEVRGLSVLPSPSDEGLGSPVLCWGCRLRDEIVGWVTMVKNRRTRLPIRDYHLEYSIAVFAVRDCSPSSTANPVVGDLSCMLSSHMVCEVEAHVLGSRTWTFQR
ncbi:hypothetical protein CDD83_6699 [Cordyceps sp. RAO-2017]|nr:hypothetical protein CDD83_6699 [Cordyceps sp. RAO-2017]